MAPRIKPTARVNGWVGEQGKDALIEPGSPLGGGADTTKTSTANAFHYRAIIFLQEWFVIN